MSKKFVSSENLAAYDAGLKKKLRAEISAAQQQATDFVTLRNGVIADISKVDAGLTFVDGAKAIDLKTMTVQKYAGKAWTKVEDVSYTKLYTYGTAVYVRRGTAMVEIGKHTPIGTTAGTAYDGAKGKAAADFIEGIKAGNKALPAVAITAQWSTFKNDGTAVANGMTPHKNIEVETGFKVKFTGTYKWTHDDSCKDPTSVDGGAWTVLSASGAASAAYTSALLDKTTTIRVAIHAAKTGLMVSGTDVKPASGLDTSADSATVTFKSRRFFGVAATPGITEAVLKGLGSELESAVGVTKTGVTLTASQYYVLAYPKSQGALTTIVQDGATPVLGAFDRSEVDVTNDAGLTQTYYVYRSSNPGAFTGAKLEFK